jgi:hypothetical protein
LPSNPDDGYAESSASNAATAATTFIAPDIDADKGTRIKGRG